MIIKEIIIYGYGKFEQFHLDSIQNLQIIYGPNEAGKTTLMSFIHSILFGFPLKQQNELRYEPRTHSKYGGQLVIEDETFGTVRIERVKGKASGDVTVVLEDGTRGGEELLKELLKGMDKSTYQAIYSFDIHALQEIQKLKGEDLNRYLFSASAIGSDQLMGTESSLEKEMGNLFKPTGTRPILNVQLKQLNETHKKVNSAKKDIANYEALLSERSEISKQIQQKRNRVKEIQEEIRSKHEWNQVYPLLIEKKQLLDELKEIGDITFPENGQSKLEQIEIELFTIKKQLGPKRERFNQLKHELDQFELDQDFLEKKDEIQLVIDDFPTYLQTNNQFKQNQLRIEELEQEINERTRHLGLSLPHEQLEKVNLSFAIRDEIVQLQNRKIQLEKIKEELDQRETKIQHELKRIQSFVEKLQNQRLSEEKRKELNEQLKIDQKKQALEIERKFILEQIENLKTATAQQSGKGFLPIILLGIVLLLVNVGLIFLQGFEWALVGMIFSIIVIGLMLIFTTNNKKKSTDSMLRNLEKKLKQIDTQLEQFQSKAHSQELAAQLLKQDAHVENQIQVEQIRYQQLEEQFTDIISDFEKWEKEFLEIEEQLVAIGEKLSLSTDLAKSYLLESYEILVEIKEKILERNNLLKKQSSIKTLLDEKEKRLDELCRFLRITSSNRQELVLILKQKLADATEQKRNFEEKERQAQELDLEIQALIEEKNLVQLEMNRLFDAAGVTTKDEFIEKSLQASRFTQINEQLRVINRQLLSMGFENYQFTDEIEPLVSEEEFQLLKEEGEELENEIEKLERRRAQLEHDIARIEDGGTYTGLLHQFYQEKYAFNEGSKEWATYRMAQFILQKAIEKYKYERLPQLLENAGEIFSHITDGQYEKISIDSTKDELFVQRNDGMIFVPQELSQATKEQLYISLRLALTFVMNKKSQMPILIDDGFVNFDETRLKQMLEVLKKLPNQQIFLFTCHQSLLQWFNKENIIELPGNIVTSDSI